MRLIVWFLRCVVFILLLGFAIKNDDVVTVRFFLDTAWHVPLVLVMLLFFAAGILLGATVGVLPLLRQRREIARLRKASEARERPTQMRIHQGADLPETY